MAGEDNNLGLTIGIDASGAEAGAEAFNQSAEAISNAASETEAKLGSLKERFVSLSASIKQTDTSHASEGISHVGHAAEEAEGILGALSERFNHLNESAELLNKGLEFLGIGAIVIGFSQLIEHAAELEESLVKVINRSGDLAGSAEQLGERIRELSNSFGVSQELEAAAAYKATAAGFKEAADNALVLEGANRIATASGTGLAQSTEALTKVMNAFGIAAADSTKTSESLYVITRAGKLEYSQLSQQLGLLAPALQGTGVSFEQAGAALSALSTTGGNARISIQGLRQIFQDVKVDSAGAELAARQYGVSIDTAALKAKGLIPFLQDIVRATDGNAEAIKKLLPGAQAYQTALLLTGQLSDKLATINDELADKNKILSESFDRVQEGAAKQAQILKTELQNVFLQLGTTILETIAPGLKLLASNFDLVTAAIEAAAIVITGRLAYSFTALAIPTIVESIGTLITGVQLLALEFSSLATVAEGLDTAFLLIGGPVGAVVLATTALTGLIYYMNSTKAAAKAMSEAVELADKSLKNLSLSASKSNLEKVDTGLETLKKRQEVLLAQKDVLAKGNTLEANSNPNSEYAKTTAELESLAAKITEATEASEKYEEHIHSLTEVQDTAKASVAALGNKLDLLARSYGIVTDAADKSQDSLSSPITLLSTEFKVAGANADLFGNSVEGIGTSINFAANLNKVLTNTVKEAGDAAEDAAKKFGKLEEQYLETALKSGTQNDVAKNVLDRLKQSKPNAQGQYQIDYTDSEGNAQTKILSQNAYTLAVQKAQKEVESYNDSLNKQGEAYRKELGGLDPLKKATYDYQESVKSLAKAHVSLQTVLSNGDTVEDSLAATRDRATLAAYRQIAAAKDVTEEDKAQTSAIFDYKESLDNLNEVYKDPSSVEYQKRLAVIERTFTDAKNSADPLIKRFIDMRANLDPVGEATRQFEANLDALNAAEEKGLIKGKAYADALVSLTSDLEDAQLKGSRFAQTVKTINDRVDPLTGALDSQAKELKDYAVAAQALNIDPATQAKTVALLKQQYQIQNDGLSDAINGTQEYRRAWQTAISGIDQQLQGLWRNGLSSFKSFTKSLEDGFKQLLASLANAAITRPILINIASSLGVSGSTLANTFGQGTVNSALGGIFGGGSKGGSGTDAASLLSNPQVTNSLAQAGIGLFGSGGSGDLGSLFGGSSSVAGTSIGNSNGGTSLLDGGSGLYSGSALDSIAGFLSGGSGGGSFGLSSPNFSGFQSQGGSGFSLGSSGGGSSGGGLSGIVQNFLGTAVSSYLRSAIFGGGGGGGGGASGAGGLLAGTTFGTALSGVGNGIGLAVTGQGFAGSALGSVASSGTYGASLAGGELLGGAGIGALESYALGKIFGNNAKSGVSLGLGAAGAAIGTAILPGIGTLVGGALGYVASQLFGGGQTTSSDLLKLNIGKNSQTGQAQVGGSRYTETRTSGGWFGSSSYSSTTQQLGQKADPNNPNDPYSGLAGQLTSAYQNTLSPFIQALQAANQANPNAKQYDVSKLQNYTASATFNLQDIKDPKKLQDAITKFLDDSVGGAVTDFLGSTGGITGNLKSLVTQFSGDMTNMLSAFQQVVQFAQLVNLDPVKEASKQVAANVSPQIQAYKDQTAALQKAIAAYDGSVTSLESLTTAFQNQKSAAVAYAAALQQINTQEQTSIQNTAQGLVDSTLNSKDLYASLSSRIGTERTQLSNTTDPTKIQSLSQQIQQQAQQAFGLLSPDQQKKDVGQYVAFLNSLSKLVQTQTDLGQKNVTTDSGKLATAATNQIAAATTNATASQTQLAAAKMFQDSVNKLGGYLGGIYDTGYNPPASNPSTTPPRKTVQPVTPKHPNRSGQVGQK